MRRFGGLVKKRSYRKQKLLAKQQALLVEVENEKKAELLSIDLNENIETIRSTYHNSSDVIFRSFAIGKRSCCLIYISGLIDEHEVNSNVLKPLMNSHFESPTFVDSLIEQKLSVSESEKLTSFNKIYQKLSAGYPVLLIDKTVQAIAIGLAKWEARSIEEPNAEHVVRGPREGFTEAIDVNLSLLRRRIRSPRLAIHTQLIGQLTETEVAVAYIDGVAENTLVEEVKVRLERIDIDGIVDSGYIEELIEDQPYSPFPQMISTERPDTATAYLLEGHVVIFANGSPFALVAPTTFYSLLQASEDYYERFLIGSAIRWLRYLFLVMALLFPSIYVAILAYHQEMLPTTLIISIASSREVVPFPVFVEALLMEIMFEVLREAGLRLPKQIGAAVSIVGALIIGEAAVQAGIVSAPMVIVVAVTGIASFAIPRYNAGISIRMLRFPMIVLAGTLGLLGIMLGVITIVIHMCSLRSFGVPYLSPLAPIKQKDLKDVLMRAPLWKMNSRPHLTGDTGQSRQAGQQRPGASRGGD
ncbi:spore germination protein [Desertibacillus haloalkaliphilus]|uniref:spore germination protein n=1 Tax=Desertibacillus haloalkaliphilus TaxID=1328930 RepID=UPI001C25E9F4|nr:spore germination protein [Desertibacillus haloalkaliphilus]MBU8906638.1 spore germination protein [Desertibacillus haloalkaliphilus]